MARSRGGMHYEADDCSFPADAYHVAGYKGIACYILGWETQPDEDTEWSGIEERTGNLVAMMVGDDRPFIVEQDDISPIEEDEDGNAGYCPSCGQIGCGWH